MTSSFLLFFKSFGTMLLSFGLYASIFGWSYAALVIILILIHEFGHWLWMQLYGLEPEGPVFVPFVGAYVAMTKLPDSEATHAWVAYAGPLIGGLGALIIFVIGALTNNIALIAGANFGFWLNILQLIPVRPFDGGFIVGAISKGVFAFGIVLVVYLAFMLRSPILTIVALLSVFSALKTFSGKVDSYSLKPAKDSQKIAIGVAYLALLSGLGYMYSYTDNALAIVKQNKRKGAETSASLFPWDMAKSNQIVLPDKKGTITLIKEAFGVSVEIKTPLVSTKKNFISLMSSSSDYKAYWYSQPQFLMVTEDNGTAQEFIIDTTNGEVLKVLRDRYGNIFAGVKPSGSYSCSITNGRAFIAGKLAPRINNKLVGKREFLGTIKLLGKEPIFEKIKSK